MALECVTDVNGRNVRNMEDLVRHVEEVKGSERFLEITVATGASRAGAGLPVKICLDCEALQEADERLMKNYRIPSDRSSHYL